jgi:hypothetical protein
MDGREGRESGLRLNASVARIAVPEERVNPKKRLGHRGEGRLKRRPAHERNTEARGAVDDVFLSLTPQVQVDRHQSGSLRLRRR